MNFTTLNSDRCKVLNLEWIDPLHQYQLGSNCLGISCIEKEVGSWCSVS